MTQSCDFTIARTDAFALRIPFGDFVDGVRAAPQGWREFDMVLVRIETTDGVVGWGECFAFSCLRPVLTAVQDMVFPHLARCRVTDIAALNLDLQFKLHIQGRYGITLFALSGVDIALWDIAAKIAGLPLAEFIGGPRRENISAYASLVRYGEPALVAGIAARAVAEGYRHVKLHEIAFAPIEAGRTAVGPDVRLMTDVNCSWSVAEAEAILSKLKALGLYWVEEPVFPPESFAELKRLARFGVDLAAGENACTAVEFQTLTEAVTFAQPSVIKVGGISEFLKVVAYAGTLGKTVMPHSPYFGPGYWATLHLASLCEEPTLFEYLFVQPDAWLSPDIPQPRAGMIGAPRRPGLGFSPDGDVLKRFRAV